ncbi:MAG: tetratricopeptide repeat protein [Planctomycetota bacterium]
MKARSKKPIAAKGWSWACICLSLLPFLLCNRLSAQTNVDDPFTSPVDATRLNDGTPDQLFNAGQYELAIKKAIEKQESIGRFGNDESLPIIIARSQMAMGQYANALATTKAGLDRYENSIQIRWIGHHVAKFNNDLENSIRWYGEIETLATRSSWRYRDTQDQLVLGKYYLSKGADAKQVLKSFFQPALKKNAADPSIYRAIGQLSLDKGDYGLAAENFTRVLEILPEDADAHFRLAKCFLRSDAEKATEHLNQALAINPKHIEAMLELVDQKIGSEDYEGAKTKIEAIRKIHPNHPAALAFLAAIAHLENQPNLESKLRSLALASWKGNPAVDHIIGRELSQKYRFLEGHKYQRRALIYDDQYLEAKIQLAHDLLRLGQEEEGWKLADQVFNQDQYNVLAHNLLTLRDEMSSFRTLAKDGFIVRMSPAEAAIYGDRVLDLLSRVSEELTKKYQAELQTPIVIEVFPKQRDFAIRTFGLPGGDGFLGVCFGRVITMNSPAAQRGGFTSWESVLWHEFCHVVTLQKTNNRMPRWLSEGISVYEEKLADSAWGESMSRRYREMLLNELTPVSQLSGAFLRPPSSAHLQFAYYESSLVVEYLVDQHGLPKLIKVLDELALGTPINKALERNIEPIDQLDKNFAAFATKRANDFAPKVDWTQPESVPPEAGVKFWADWNQAHPNNLFGLVSEAAARLQSEDFDQAIELARTAIQLCPEDGAAYPVLAAGYRRAEQFDEEYATLQRFAKLEASDPDLYIRLLELSDQRSDWESMKTYAHRLAAVNPLMKLPHQYLSKAAEKTDDFRSNVQALTVLAEMEPLDVADLRYRLAIAYNELEQKEPALRQVLMALEQAPRYRDAHLLLLKLVKEPAPKTVKENLK